MRKDETRDAIREKIVQLARSLGHDATELGNDEFLPQAGVLDSAATMELIVWLEDRFSVPIPDDDLTLDNFGTIDQMVAYLQRT